MVVGEAYVRSGVGHGAVMRTATDPGDQRKRKSFPPEYPWNLPSTWPHSVLSLYGAFLPQRCDPVTSPELSPTVPAGSRGFPRVPCRAVPCPLVPAGGAVVCWVPRPHAALSRG